MFIYYTGCSSIPYQSKDFTVINCPNVFFSSENNILVNVNEGKFDLDNVNYKASLNNYGFEEKCTVGENNKYYGINILVVVEPLNPKIQKINLPIFVLLYDMEDTLVDKQFFRIQGELNYNNDFSNYEVTEIIENLSILVSKEKEVSSMTIGFVKLN